MVESNVGLIVLSVSRLADGDRLLTLHTRRSEFNDDQLQEVRFRCRRQTQEPFVKRRSIPAGQSFTQTELKLNMRSLKLAARLSASDVFMYHCLQGKSQ